MFTNFKTEIIRYLPIQINYMLLGKFFADDLQKRFFYTNVFLICGS